jgi:hypothetical protein
MVFEECSHPAQIRPHVAADLGPLCPACGLLRHLSSAWRDAEKGGIYERPASR